MADLDSLSSTIPQHTFDNAVVQLREVWIKVQASAYDVDLEPAVAEADKKAVIARYQPIFSPDHLPRLTEAEFRGFLMFRNNKHWSGLQRMGPRICRDMDALRTALGHLLDESVPLAVRYDRSVGAISGLGRAVATPILMISHPQRYGVWNNVAEGALKGLDLWPAFDRGEGEGSRYEKINAMVLRVAAAVDVDTWILDSLWHFYLRGELVDGADDYLDAAAGPASFEDEEEVDALTDQQRFGLERHLQDFLWENWDRTELGRQWARYTEPGNETAGYEYPCGVGRIDILARDRRSSDWLVVELKRAQTSDSTVGQVLRYMGWVQQHLAEGGEQVRGLIIGPSRDERLRYAVQVMPNVSFMTYEVQFTLRAVEARG